MLKKSLRGAIIVSAGDQILTPSRSQSLSDLDQTLESKETSSFRGRFVRSLCLGINKSSHKALIGLAFTATSMLCVASAVVGIAVVALGFAASAIFWGTVCPILAVEFTIGTVLILGTPFWLSSKFFFNKAAEFSKQF